MPAGWRDESIGRQTPSGAAKRLTASNSDSRIGASCPAILGTADFWAVNEIEPRQKSNLRSLAMVSCETFLARSPLPLSRAPKPPPRYDKAGRGMNNIPWRSRGIRPRAAPYVACFSGVGAAERQLPFRMRVDAIYHNLFGRCGGLVICGRLAIDASFCRSLGRSAAACWRWRCQGGNIIATRNDCDPWRL